MEWSLSENNKILTTPTGIKIPLEAEAFGFEICGQVAVVLLKKWGRFDSVFAVETNGNVRWKMSEDTAWKNPFTGALCQGSTIRLLHPEGYAFIVDVVTGKILDIEQTK